MYRCIFCEEKFKSETALRGHRVAIHKEDKKYKCDHCDEAFSLKSDVERHVKSIHEECILIPRNFFCDLCDTNYKTKKKSQGSCRESTRKIHGY